MKKNIIDIHSFVKDIIIQNINTLQITTQYKQNKNNCKYYQNFIMKLDIMMILQKLENVVFYFQY